MIAFVRFYFPSRRVLNILHVPPFNLRYSVGSTKWTEQDSESFSH